MKGKREEGAKRLAQIGQYVLHVFSEAQFTNVADNRHQPPVPINQSLGDLLELVKDSSDPWLLFLCVTFNYQLSKLLM